MKKICLISLAAFLVLIALLATGLFFAEKSKKSNEEKASTPTKQASASATKGEENVDQIIKKCMISAGSPFIKDVTITKKVYYTDASGVQWIRFHVTPIPENATDPAYGVMKKVPGDEWEIINFGTAGVEDNLPADVKTGLGF